MQVWIMESGEDYEGGSIRGVYVDRDLARDDFLTAARELTQDGRWEINRADRDDEGNISLHAGCDWLTLSVYDAKERAEIAR